MTSIPNKLSYESIHVVGGVLCTYRLWEVGLTCNFGEAICIDEGWEILMMVDERSCRRACWTRLRECSYKWKAIRNAAHKRPQFYTGITRVDHNELTQISANIEHCLLSMVHSFYTCIIGFRNSFDHGNLLSITRRDYMLAPEAHHKPIYYILQKETDIIIHGISVKKLQAALHIH